MGSRAIHVVATKKGRPGSASAKLASACQLSECYTLLRHVYEGSKALEWRTQSL